jgi:mono/diheme cytochrome c family protein
VLTSPAAIAALLFVARLAATEPGETFAAAAPKVDFNREIRPLLAKNCFACHGPDPEHRAKDLRLDRFDAATSEREGRFAIRPGDPASSELLSRLRTEDESKRMPPAEVAHRLAPAEIAKLERWIESGAEYEPHWAFVPPQRRAPSTTPFDALAKNAVDRHIFAALEEQGLEPSPPADPATLARRVAFDITGLPPRPEWIAEFENDPSDAAYARLVDRLLASPAYGERMARLWLDLARYADSAGYGSDPLRTIWRWRDWVIDAFNANLPYDRFTIEQLAGDLLPNPTRDQLLATAFHRNTLTNTEGGTDNEEFRVAAVKDRTNVTMQVFMGLTFGCAQCHTHKFDPITHDDYYRLYDFLNQTEDADRSDEEPKIATPTAAELAEVERIEGEIARLEDALAARGKMLGESITALAAENERLVAAFSPLRPRGFRITSIGRYTIAGDASVIHDGDLALREEMALGFESERTVRALALEALTHDSLPNRGPGTKGGNGNFVVNEFEVRRLLPKTAPPPARFVRVELPGESRILSLAEVEVISEGSNVARGAAATQSSVDYAGDAARAIDGDRNGDYNAGSVTHTREGADPWFEIDLGAARPIDRIAIFNRTGGNLHLRFAGAIVRLLDAERREVYVQRIAAPPAVELVLDATQPHAPVSVTRASADFEQDGFAVASAIDGDLAPARGWAISPRLGESHVAVFELAEPVSGPFEIVLTQNYGSYHVLGRFRVLGSESELPHPLLSPRIAAILRKPAVERDRTELAALVEHFAANDAEVVATKNAIAEARARLEPLLGVQTPILRELPANARRATHVMAKGNFLAPMHAVEAATPSSLHPWPADAPRNRLGLAQWIVDPANPLFSRVFVNRIHAMLFGQGLVFTEEDFGLQGSNPSNQGLLDELAVAFVEHGYDVKWLVREFVTSYTYRQRSTVLPEHLAKDPTNRLLARGPRFRLEAEMVRDQALAVAGLLSSKMHGPPVYPPQPDGMWRAAFNGERTYETSQGEDRWRRAIYTVWRRTAPHPALSTFDTPSRETCSLRRTRTNTPLQAFVTLNDPAFVECAQALARRLLTEGGADDAARLALGLELTLGRRADPAAVRTLVELVAAERAHFAGDVAAATALATEPLGALPAGIDPIDAAAYTVAANVLLNQDAFLTKD